MIKKSVWTCLIMAYLATPVISFAGEVFGATAFTEQDIARCLKDELESTKNAHYEIVKRPMRVDASHTITEYHVTFDDRPGVYLFVLKSWSDRRVLSLTYPEKLERKDRFLNYIIQKCT